MKLNIPIRFTPQLKNYLWGGESLKNRCSLKKEENGPIGESWEISDCREDVSVVAEGPLKGMTLRELMKACPYELCKNGVDPLHPHLFPLLLKIIDAKLPLSIQVHPDNKLAQEMQLGELGKTEAWYVLEAKPGASLYCGVKEGVTKADLKAALNEGKLPLLLEEIPVAQEDVIFIPAGTIHAIGGGLKIMEIQQNSNTTYRLFDWNRLDNNGKARPLHLEEGFRSIHLGGQGEGLKRPVKRHEDSAFLKEHFIECDPFTFERFSQFRQESVTIINDDESFHILTLLKGKAMIRSGGQEVIMGPLDSVLLPAIVSHYEILATYQTEFLHFYK